MPACNELQLDFEIREEAIRRQEYYAYDDRLKAEKMPL